jgi:uncharacterized protein (DUF169 family)
MSWSDLSKELVSTLRLKTDPIAFSRLEKAADLEKIRNVQRIPRLYTFCQAQFLVRVERMTIGITKEDKMNIRCMRLHGVRHASEKSMQLEAEMLSTTWFPNPAEALQQQKDSPRVPVAEAVIMAPLDKEKFEPEVVLVYGNPAQLMMLMCGLQKEKYERFDFHFVGEGACSDSLGECYKTGKPQLAIPCYGERSMGQVSDDEISLALPPAEIPRALSGLKKLAKVGFKYPIGYIGARADLEPILSQVYPSQFGK